MDSNMKKFIDLSIWTTAILLVIRSLLSWSDLINLWESGQIISFCYTIFGFIGEAIGTTAVIMYIFNKWAWRWKLLRFIHNHPILSAQYTGYFISDYDQKKRTCTLLIEQTFLKTSVECKTKESQSGSITASFNILQGRPYLVYTFQNEPHAEIQNISPIHYGTTMLNVSNVLNLEGNYFTGRNTRGSMHLKVSDKAKNNSKNKH